MLAQTAESVDQALDWLGEAAVEFKIDGARIQVHKADDEVRVYTRNLREVTSAVPEVVEIVRASPARSLVLDGEVIALRADQTPQPFQITMRRSATASTWTDFAPRCRRAVLLPAAFTQTTVRSSTSAMVRFDALREWAGPAAIVTRSAPTIAGKPPPCRSALERGHEGVMMKAPTAPYTAGSRGQAWLKVKATRTLDLVVLAAEWGSGRRRGWLSNLHLGARDTEGGGSVMLGKTFKGLTDELLTWQTRELLAREIGRDAHTVFVKPELVVEIVFNDLQVSPVYPGGLALRFARVKGYRPDKSSADADTFSTVQDIYRRLTGLEPPAR
jgi:DNA ligase-1